MIRRLRSLPAPARYTAYVVCAFLLLFLALGVGVAVGFLAGRELGTNPTSPMQADAAEGGGSGTTGMASTPESTTGVTSGDSRNVDDAPGENSSFYRASDANSRGDYTYINDPRINGDAEAVILAVPARTQTGARAADYGHNIGVWFEPVRRKWAVFNQDRAPVPDGSTFKVTLSRPSLNFVHRADVTNIAGYYTYIDNRLTNGKPGAVLSVTQNWNPGGGTGVYNDHPIGIEYDPELGQWAVFNEDGAPIPQGTSFNVVVSSGSG